MLHGQPYHETPSLRKRLVCGDTQTSGHGPRGARGVNEAAGHTQIIEARGGNVKEGVPLLGPYLAQGTLQLGFFSEENFFSRKAHISSAVSISERAASTGQTFEGSLEDFTSSMSSSA